MHYAVIIDADRVKRELCIAGTLRLLVSGSTDRGDKIFNHDTDE